MDYEEQLSAAKFRAERDQARQEVKELREELDAASKDVLRSEIVDQCMDNIEREIKLGINSIAELLEIGGDIQELPIAEVCPRIVAELEKRLMPKGYEWPRYESGEKVKLGDEVVGPDYGESIHADEITFHANGFTVREKTGLDHWYESDARFKHPAVIAADGERVKRPQDSAADDGCCEPGTYRCQEAAFTCDSCGHTVFVDKCMVDEVRYLRAKGIRTLNCCCGHGGKVEPFIIVNDGDECRMLNMGYERHVNEHGATYFTPKSSCPTKVIAADGEPLEAGQTVWRVDTGAEYWVKRSQTITSDAVVIIRKTDCDCESEIVKASQLTHQRPVLDADGVPIKTRQTMWRVRNGEEVRVSQIDRGKHPIITYIGEDGLTHEITPDGLTHTKPVIGADGLPIKVGQTAYNMDNGIEVRVDSIINEEGGAWTSNSRGNYFLEFDQLTHTKPEPRDSWERVEEDAGCTATKYNERRGTIFTTKQQVARDLVRRCRTLAERERGE